ncbi:hypothetical protein Hanom_Chr06g00554141 [Helianthus anomalus]
MIHALKLTYSSLNTWNDNSSWLLAHNNPNNITPNYKYVYLTTAFHQTSYLE